MKRFTVTVTDENGIQLEGSVWLAELSSEWNTMMIGFIPDHLALLKSEIMNGSMAADTPAEAAKLLCEYMMKILIKRNRTGAWPLKQ